MKITDLSAEQLNRALRATIRALGPDSIEAETLIEELIRRSVSPREPVKC